MVKTIKTRQKTLTNRQREIDAYTYDEFKRSNIPAAGLAELDSKNDDSFVYDYDPHLDPELIWAGKGTESEVPTLSIHMHESIKPHKIINSVIGDVQLTLWETPENRIKRRADAIQFYKHGVDWTNRLIAGDSEIVMNSLLQKEGMGGSVQMVYFDPPYGISYSSNFQPFVNKRDVRETDDDLSKEPEMIKAFRDTWQLGIHSYLSYIRSRLRVARDLLSDSGSVFVQISDENIHLIRNVCDEIFGKENFVSIITYSSTSGFPDTSSLSRGGDYIVWYAKDKAQMKYHQLYLPKVLGDEGSKMYSKIEFADGTRMTISEWKKQNPDKLFDYANLPEGSRLFRIDNLQSQGSSSVKQPFEFNGVTYLPKEGNHWKANYPEGMNNLKEAKRIDVGDKGSSLSYIRYWDDFSFISLNNIWTDTSTGGFNEEKTYVVQTNTKIVQRCMLMCSDPGDLILDITCGSGTTAVVAERWGRRWITCDTSRVAISLAKQRLMTATFDYYKLSHPDVGVSGGFIYKTAPHIKLETFANNEPPKEETLYDQPIIDETKIRISGPFTVEALPAPIGPVNAVPLDEYSEYEEPNTGVKDWCDILLSNGIRGKNGDMFGFSRVELQSTLRHIHAEGETNENPPRQVAICFADESTPLDTRMVEAALDDISKIRPRPQVLIFVAFQFDPYAAKLISEVEMADVEMLQVQMNPDLLVKDLKKKDPTGDPFWLIGQPDVELIRIPSDNPKERSKYMVKVNGFDYFDIKQKKVISGGKDDIAMWMLDTDYDRMCVEPKQVFFPLAGKNGGWNKLAKTLRTDINTSKMKAFEGTESLPFRLKEGAQIAVKIMDNRGVESMIVLDVGDIE